MVAFKKGKYVYYHCTGHRQRSWRLCRSSPKYVREEVLNDTFGTLLDQLHFDEEVLDWLKTALKASHADERREHEQAIHRCQTEYKRLEDRLQAIYLDKLDGRIDNVFYDRMSAQWRTEQARLLREIERHGQAEEAYMDDGIRLQSRRRVKGSYSQGIQFGWATYAGHRFARELDEPDIGDALPFRREVTALAVD
jgi:hypothetical protein